MEQAQTAALQAANIEASNASISSSTLSEVAGVTCYKVEFTSGDYVYAYSINAESGEVLEASYRDKNAAPADSAQTDTTVSGATTTPAQSAPNTNTSTGAVDEAKAQEIALAHAGVVGVPFSKVVLRLALVPAYHIQLFCPAARAFGKHTYIFCDLKFQFSHFYLPPLVLFFIYRHIFAAVFYTFFVRRSRYRRERALQCAEVRYHRRQQYHQSAENSCESAA